ncbi:pentapeptide repeat-containing protein [Streptomyces botrytidirepellens]|uniref:Pentapeptide repeat-containing protein n=1 Tax=Streptomyces botrytidirepellens TaxID=2486417 RepID=A0A3M8W7L2_9ACTN|nr:pentapeptide repeat-containing protein [Streptomyces botrytidirepellens]RNG26098.1 pentapeptide repeat-containing protein [Streptomyces botrytidirepellens]
MRAFRQWPPGAAWTAAAGALVVGGALTLVFTPVGRWVAQWAWGPDWPRMDDAARSAALGQFRLAVVQTAAFLGAGTALVLTGFTYRLSRRGQVTDRFTKALERLGSPDLHVRIGGILVLEEFVRDWPEQATHAAHVLGAFVRDRAPRARRPKARGAHDARGAAALRGALNEKAPPSLARARLHGAPDADVQAALTALTRPASRLRALPHHTIDLSELDLSYAELSRADLAGARLVDTDLTGARLAGAKLTATCLQGADLTRAELDGADLTYAQLDRADLSSATLERADLSGAWLNGANLTGARLDEADLTRAQMDRTDLTGAHLDAANLTDAQIQRANLSEARLVEADLTRACLDADLTGAALHGAVLTDTWLGSADLREVGLLSAEQVAAACPTPTTRLPSEIADDPRVTGRIATVATWGFRWNVTTVSVTFTRRTARGTRGAKGDEILAFRRNAIETGPATHGSGSGEVSAVSPSMKKR